MTDTPHVLAQSLPTGVNFVTAYTVPAGTNTIISSFTICNIQGISLGVMSSGNVWIVPSGGILTSSNINALFSGVQIAPSDTFIATVGITLAAGDIILVKSFRGNDLAFHIYGDEVT